MGQGTFHPQDHRFRETFRVREEPVGGVSGEDGDDEEDEEHENRHRGDRRDVVVCDEVEEGRRTEGPESPVDE